MEREGLRVTEMTLAIVGLVVGGVGIVMGVAGLIVGRYFWSHESPRLRSNREHELEALRVTFEGP
jgi:cytochrome c biogenesis factor